LADFGWTYLSRVALAKAEAQLSAESQGVRDEIGFLLIHQHYADRFFPGTSVLHTRLRYVLFVPWMYQLLSQGRTQPAPEEAIRKMEGDLCRRLLKFEPHQLGIIGRLSGGKNMGQPPSMVYWNALVKWGLVRKEGGKVPSRHRMARIAGNGRPRASCDSDLIENTELLPLDLLPPPPNLSAESLSFSLSPLERAYLCRKLRDLTFEGNDERAALMAHLVRQIEKSKNMPLYLQTHNCWDEPVLDLAELERDCLIRAGNAAAMAAIGRGIYAALVEKLRQRENGTDVGDLHRRALLEAIDLYRERALELDVSKLADEARGVPDKTLHVLRATQVWLNRPRRDFTDLHDVYTKAEWARKGERSRLSMTPNGRNRRLDWKSENVGLNGQERTQAEPLHYRWGVVQRLLTDLHGGSDVS
jgi:hypothetical protein